MTDKTLISINTIVEEYNNLVAIGAETRDILDYLSDNYTMQYDDTNLNFRGFVRKEGSGGSYRGVF